MHNEAADQGGWLIELLNTFFFDNNLIKTV
jgi:hypothetical protein